MVAKSFVLVAVLHEADSSHAFILFPLLFQALRKTRWFSHLLPPALLRPPHGAGCFCQVLLPPSSAQQGEEGDTPPLPSHDSLGTCPQGKILSKSPGVGNTASILAWLQSG